jgi:hypothetical protein
MWSRSASSSGTASVLHRRGRVQRKQRRAQNLSRGKDYTPLHEILQLANVPGPRIGAEFRDGFWGNLVDLLTHPMGIDLDKVFQQGRNVFAMRP